MTTDPFDDAGLPVSDPDELAGVVDLFGALSTAELARALVELGYRQDGSLDEGAVGSASEAAVEWAVDRYYLVAYEPAASDQDADPALDTDVDADADADSDPSGPRLVTVGPVSFPTLPPDAEDLPHILSYPTREVSREALAQQVEAQLRGDAARAVAAEDDARIQHLLDVTYDLEAWAGVDVEEIRTRLDAALAATESD